MTPAVLLGVQEAPARARMAAQRETSVFLAGALPQAAPASPQQTVLASDSSCNSERTSSDISFKIGVKLFKMIACGIREVGANGPICGARIETQTWRTGFVGTGVGRLGLPGEVTLTHSRAQNGQLVGSC